MKAVWLLLMPFRPSTRNGGPRLRRRLSLQIWEAEGELLRLRDDCHFLGIWDDSSKAPLKALRACSEAATLTTTSKGTLFARAAKNKARPSANFHFWRESRTPRKP